MGVAAETVSGQSLAEDALAVPAVPFRERLAILGNEVVAWFKTLASAAVYATLIVTFGVQVADDRLGRERRQVHIDGLLGRRARAHPDRRAVHEDVAGR